MIVHLDLDRTVFKTDEMGAVRSEIARLYPEAAGALEARQSFYAYVEGMYFHDMSAQLVSFGIDPEEIYASLLNSSYADGRLEYEGCKELIRSLQGMGAEVRILTFGSEDHQRFKAALCPSLRGLDIITTIRPKRDYLDDVQEECWLVDDKPLGDELPNNVSFVQVSHDGRAVPQDAFWTVKRSLNEVKEFFELLKEQLTASAIQHT